MRMAWVALFGLCAACGGSSGDDDGTAQCDVADAPDLSNRLYPWKVGTVWTYLLTDPATGGSQVNDTTVEAWEGVAHGHPTTCAFRVTGEKLFGNTISWNSYEGDIGVRYAQEDYDQAGTLLTEQHQDPYRFKIDETASHMTAGAIYSEDFMETTVDPGGTVTRAKSEDWEVIATDESVTVPAGTYTALHVRRTNPDSAKVKDFWFVRGVGKVKEVGGEQNQDLMAYTP